MTFKTEILRNVACVAVLAQLTTASNTTIANSWTNPFPVQRCNGIDIQDITVASLQAHFANGSLTAVQLAGCYVDRIQTVNPYVHHVIELNPDWKHIAQTLDDERANGTVRGPLHGIPVLTKDNIATDDKQMTTGTILQLPKRAGADDVPQMAT
jgi:amidase